MSKMERGREMEMAGIPLGLRLMRVMEV